MDVAVNVTAAAARYSLAVVVRALQWSVELTTRWSRVQFPAAASTGMGDRLRVVTKPPRSIQPPTLCGTGNEYHPSVMMLCSCEVKSGMAHSTCGWQVKL